MGWHTVHQSGDLTPLTEVGSLIFDQIRALKEMPVPALKEQWRVLFGTEPPPHAKRSFLTQVIAWKIQADAFGGLKPALRRQLMQFGRTSTDKVFDTYKSVPSELRPGIKLIRMWKGVTHHVLVTETGFFWQDRTWRSLSMIAREITGTPWSGPVFFGLKKSKVKGSGKAMPEDTAFIIGSDGGDANAGVHSIKDISSSRVRPEAALMDEPTHG